MYLQNRNIVIYDQRPYVRLLKVFFPRKTEYFTLKYVFKEKKRFLVKNNKPGFSTHFYMSSSKNEKYDNVSVSFDKIPYFLLSTAHYISVPITKLEKS